MVEPNQAAAGGDLDLDDMTDDQFEAWAKAQPKMTEEEQAEAMEEWVNHPLNCRELTPEMLERPEYQALMALSHEGSPMEVQNNFKHHAYE